MSEKSILYMRINGLWNVANIHAILEWCLCGLRFRSGCISRYPYVFDTQWGSYTIIRLQRTSEVTLDNMDNSIAGIE